MTDTLDYSRKGPQNPERLVIFLHGYGADGADLLGLADPLGEHLPGTAFVAPNAPERSAMNPMGYQWFPLPWLDGSSEEESRQAMLRAGADLDRFLDHILAEEGVSAADTMLFGFSQGTMIALQVAPRRAEAFAGIVAFSGRLLQPEALIEEVVVRPPVMLVHGDSDEVVPVQSLRAAAEGLEAAGWSQVYAFVQKGAGHTIAQDGLGMSLGFMRQFLGLEPA